MSIYHKAVELLKSSSNIVAFTGAGISVESGIPPFRGKGGLWNSYDPSVLDLDYYINNTQDSWRIIKELFFDFFGAAKPNDAHRVLARLEKQNKLHSIITQNIDSLHQKAGSSNVVEFHGNSRQFVCMQCGNIVNVDNIIIDKNPPMCKICKGLLKPDFIFFGEGIPKLAMQQSYNDVRKADILLIIGTTGEVMPASDLPIEAKRFEAKIIEINPKKSLFTNKITDIYIPIKASEAMLEIEKLMFK